MRNLTCLALFALSACATNGSYPPKADIQAITESKPIPPPEILTDAAASDLYNSQLEGYADRLHSAGVRLCRYFRRTGMRDLTCD
jgi:hypothetical protein